jgi:hypothetical protein
MAYFRPLIAFREVAELVDAPPKQADNFCCWGGE